MPTPVAVPGRLAVRPVSLDPAVDMEVLADIKSSSAEPPPKEPRAPLSVDVPIADPAVCGLLCLPDRVGALKPSLMAALEAAPDATASAPPPPRPDGGLWYIGVVGEVFVSVAGKPDTAVALDRFQLETGVCQSGP